MIVEMERHPNSSFENINEQDYLVIHMTQILEHLYPCENSILAELCIHSAPHKIRLANQEAYTPRVVSIGPIHNPNLGGGDWEVLGPMEELKRQYLKSFVNGSQLSMKDCVSRLRDRETSIRRCYAETPGGSDDFLEMVLIDAGFIIEHFLRYFSHEDWIERDPIFSKPWLANDVAHDLILLENQLPFFVLNDLYNLSIAPRATADLPSFTDLTFNYFKTHNHQNMRPEDVRGVQHFTDLLRTFMLPISVDREPPKRRVDLVQHLYSASQLSEAGLNFKVGPSKCLKFHKGVLTMPCFKVHSSTEVLMRNIVAFELSNHPSSPYITEYIKILHFLMNRGKDVGILVDKKIIVNFLGDDDEVAAMVNNLGSMVTLPRINSEFRSLCDQLNGFYENPRNKYKAIFVHEYFNTPWKIASTIAAIVLLLLTLIQTVCSIVSLFKG